MNTDKRINGYLRQTGSEVITLRQRRRHMKKIRREIYNKPCSGCGHRPKTNLCQCPF